MKVLRFTISYCLFLSALCSNHTCADVKRLWEGVGCCYDRSIPYCNYVKEEFKLHCNHTCIDGTDGTDTYVSLITSNYLDLLTEKELNCMINDIGSDFVGLTMPNSTECGMRGFMGCQWASSTSLCMPSCQYNTTTECGTKRHCMYTNGKCGPLDCHIKHDFNDGLSNKTATREACSNDILCKVYEEGSFVDMPICANKLVAF